MTLAGDHANHTRHFPVLLTVQRCRSIRCEVQHFGAFMFRRERTPLSVGGTPEREPPISAWYGLWAAEDIPHLSGIRSVRRRMVVQSFTVAAHRVASPGPAPRRCPSP